MRRGATLLRTRRNCCRASATSRWRSPLPARRPSPRAPCTSFTRSPSRSCWWPPRSTRPRGSGRGCAPSSHRRPHGRRRRSSAGRRCRYCGPRSRARRQDLFKTAMTALAAMAVIVTARDHLRATDLYLFPIGVLTLMATIFVLWFAEQQGWEPDSARIDAGGVAMVALLFPALGGLAARGRNGFARTLMLLGRLRLRHRRRTGHRRAARRGGGSVFRRLRHRAHHTRRQPGGRRSHPRRAAASGRRATLGRRCSTPSSPPSARPIRRSSPPPASSCTTRRGW